MSLEYSFPLWFIWDIDYSSLCCSRTLFVLHLIVCIKAHPKLPFIPTCLPRDTVFRLWYLFSWKYPLQLNQLSRWLRLSDFPCYWGRGKAYCLPVLPDSGRVTCFKTFLLGFRWPAQRECMCSAPSNLAWSTEPWGARCETLLACILLPPHHCPQMPLPSTLRQRQGMENTLDSSSEVSKTKKSLQIKSAFSCIMMTHNASWNNS